MLTPEAIESTIPLAEKLDAKRIVLSPKEGTPLAHLVQVSRINDNYMLHDVVPSSSGGYYPSVPDMVYIVNIKDRTLDACAHDDVQEDLVNVCVKSIQDQFNLARTIVSPACVQLADRTQESVNALTTAQLTNMEVVTWNPPLPLANSNFYKMVENWEGAAYFEPEISPRLPDMAGKEIMENLSTGNGNIDQDVQAWAAGCGEGFFESVWRALFQDYKDSKSFHEFMTDTVAGMDYALATFLLANRLYDNPPENTVMKLPVYNEAMKDMRDQAAGAVCRHVERLQRDEKNGILLRAISHNKAVVFGPLYKKWIQDGGSVEVMYGNMLSNTPQLTVAGVNEKAVDFLKAWEHHEMILQTTETNRLFNRTKEFLLFHFQDQLTDDAEQNSASMNDSERVMTLFEEELKKMRLDDLDDLYMLCLKLICRSRFVLTESERILMGIHHVCKQNAKLDLHEAAAISMIDYVSYWLASQMKATTV